MTRETRREGFEFRAKEAEEVAAKAQEPQTRDQWLKIAEAYRQLAKTT